MTPNFAVPRVLEIDIHMDSKLFLNILQEIISPNSKIHIAPNIPSKKLFNALGEYGIDIYPKDVLLLIDDTTFGSATEGLILADNKFYIHPTAKKNIIIDLDAINNISCKKNKLFIDNEMVFNPSSPDAVDIAKFYTALIICIKYGVGIQSIDIKDESSQENSGDGKRKVLNIKWCSDYSARCHNIRTYIVKFPGYNTKSRILYASYSGAIPLLYSRYSIFYHF